MKRLEKRASVKVVCENSADGELEGIMYAGRVCGVGEVREHHLS